MIQSMLSPIVKSILLSKSGLIYLGLILMIAPLRVHFIKW